MSAVRPPNGMKRGSVGGYKAVGNKACSLCFCEPLRSRLEICLYDQLQSRRIDLAAEKRTSWRTVQMFVIGEER